MSRYAPDRAHIVWLDYDPQRGHEQAGKRPAMVISPIEYNEKAGRVLFFPITSQIKGNPFEVRIKSTKIDGVILSDQIKSLDWKAGNISYIETAPDHVLDDAIEKLHWLLEE